MSHIRYLINIGVWSFSMVFWGTSRVQGADTVSSDVLTQPSTGDATQTQPPPIEAVSAIAERPIGSAEVDADIPAITPGETLTFNAAIKAADARNLTLSAARLEIEKVRAQLKQAMGLILPMIQAGVQFIHNDHEDTVNFTESMGPLFSALGISAADLGDGDYVVRPQNMANGSVQARIALIDPKSWADIHVAKKGITLAETSVAEARQQLLFGVAKAYFFALMSQTLIALHEDQIRSAIQHLSNATERLNAGVGIRIDVIRAKTDLEQARQRLMSAHKAFDNARDTLGQLTGVGGLPIPVSPKDIRAPSESDDVLIEHAQKQRTDLRVKQAAVVVADRQLTASWAQFLPTMDAVFQFQYQFTNPPDLGSDDRSRWAAVLTLTVPLYNHFRYGDLDYKRAALRQAKIAATDVSIQIGLEIRKTRRDYLDALSSVSIAEKQVALAKEALNLVEESYAAGTGSSLEVTDARRTASAADINLAAQQLKAELALLDLLKAVGDDVPSLP